MPNLYALLTYLGVLPFVAISIGLLFGGHELGYFGSLVKIIESYGLIIVSFMAGTHWGIYISQAIKPKTNLLLTSNIIALSAWLCFLFAPTKVTLWAYGLSFALLLYIDAELVREKAIMKDYFRTRAIVSLLVISSLVLILIVI